VCSKCFSKRNYSEIYDAYYCQSCDIWLENTCGSKECDYCFNRPLKPSLVVSHTGDVRTSPVDILEIKQQELEK
jgi:hypothetical protein